MTPTASSAQALRRLRELLHVHPLVGDAALVAALVTLGLLPRLGDLPATAGSRAFCVALTVPLLWRRRWPVAVFAGLAAVATLQWALDVRAFGDAALLVALYTVALERSSPATLAAMGVIEVGIVLAATRWAVGDGWLAPAVGLSGLATAAAVMGTNTRNRRTLLASLEERAQRLERERDQQGRIAAAEERARIAREMHDIVAHNVSVLIALADGASYAIRDDPARAEEAMLTASRSGRQALAEMRRLLGVLQHDDDASPLTPQPGLGELDALVEGVRNAGLPIAFAVTGTPAALLPGGLQLAVFRIVQEALTNTLKHAGAGAMSRLSVTHLPDALDVDILDDGCGERGPDAAGSGSGLRGMRERAAVYEGRLDAGPALGGGWQVHLRVPLGPAV